MSNRPEDFPSTPITKEAHSGLPGVPDDVAERVDNPNFEFDTPLSQKANELPTPEDLGYTANVRGVDHPTIPLELQQAAREKIEADRQRQASEAKSKRQKKIALIAAGATIVGSAIAGGIITLNNPAGALPQKPAATGPAVPGQSEMPLPATPSANETVSYVPVTEADVKGYNELVEKSKITRAEVSDGNNILPSLVDRINEIINVTLTDDEIAASKNMISETGKVGPEALAEMKRSALGSSFGDKNSNFYKGFLKEGEENFRYWMATRNEAEPYKAEFVPTDTYGEYAYKTNVNKNSLEDSADASVFKFVSIYAELRIPKGSKAADGNWVVTGQPKIVKTGETVPNS